MIETFSFPTDEFVLVGKVTKAHGIKGELKVVPFSGEPESITQHTHLILISRRNQISPPFAVLKARPGNRKEIIVRLEGVNDRNQADDVTGCGVLVKKTDLPDLTNDEFYLHELEGNSVRTVEGQELGTVEAFSTNGMQDILVVKSGTEEYLIPLIPGMITERKNDCLIIAPPPGLLDINSGDDAKGKTPRDI